MSRLVVWLPAPAMTERYISVSSRVSVRWTPCSSSNSVLTKRVMMSSFGFAIRASTHSA